MFGQRAVSSEAWSERLLALLLIAVVLAAIDQTVKLTVSTPLWAVHHRSDLWFVGSCLVLVAVLPLTRLPSRGVAIAAGRLRGGVLGNLLSASADGLNVPNPIIIMHGMGGVAFNPADAFIEAGNLALMADAGLHLPAASGRARRLARERPHGAAPRAAAERPLTSSGARGGGDPSLPRTPAIVFRCLPSSASAVRFALELLLQFLDPPLELERPSSAFGGRRGGRADLRLDQLRDALREPTAADAAATGARRPRRASSRRRRGLLRGLGLLVGGQLGDDRGRQVLVLAVELLVVRRGVGSVILRGDQLERRSPSPHTAGSDVVCVRSGSAFSADCPLLLSSSLCRPASRAAFGTTTTTVSSPITSRRAASLCFGRLGDRDDDASVLDSSRHGLEPLSVLSRQAGECVRIEPDRRAVDVAEVPLLGEQPRDILFRRKALTDDNLAEPLACLAAQMERLVELHLVQAAFGDQQGTEGRALLSARCCSAAIGSPPSAVLDTAVVTVGSTSALVPYRCRRRSPPP